MLGVSIVFVTAPANLGYAIHAFRGSVDRRCGVAALCLAIMIAAPIALGLIVGTVMGIAQAFS